MYVQAEITHGRVAMLATLGWLVPDTRTTIGAVADSSVANALFGHSSFDFGAEALRNPIVAAQALGPQFFGELIVIAAAIELYRSAYSLTLADPLFTTQTLIGTLVTCAATTASSTVDGHCTTQH
jgi:Chlorophyll A-B binding protein